VEHTAEALRAGGHPRALDRGLRRYRKAHRARTRGHYYHITSFSKVRSYNPIEQLIFSAATRDARVAARVLTYLGRTVGPLHLMAPSNLCRAALVNLRHRLSGGAGAAADPASPRLSY